MLLSSGANYADTADVAGERWRAVTAIIRSLDPPTPPEPGEGPYALSNVPAMSSRPAAQAKLFLDFNGDTTTAWGKFKPGTTPAYDLDGDTATFTEAERAAMTEVWQRVSEAFSPLDLDVTTVDPGNATNGRTLRVVIGGGGSWFGEGYGGAGYLDSFTNTDATYGINKVFVFAKNLNHGDPVWVAPGVSHEAGHGFGLEHQSVYDASGDLTDEYNPGTAARAPLMGRPFAAERGLWWRGASGKGPTRIQDDLATLARTANGFGYRADDVGSTTFAAEALSLSGSTFSAGGVIEKTTDADHFSFQTGAGAVSLSLGVAPAGAMLDATLDVRNAAGALVASADTAGLGESLTLNLAAGTYYAVVRSHGSYGDVGQYTLTGTVAPAEAGTSA